ncbi:hypothetical protein ACXFAU_10915 [Paenibacillus glucanolyticus]|uniref:hypothetical protein n=1 Tax=Paenibacillus sp. LBL TaxID=2940563 RepID=UPI002475DE35|nr:hypothetical protein [Paenibacillus sp. LBL]MDH6672004.1 hypothetical protein [Paenibacillus sp. LBL]
MRFTVVSLGMCTILALSLLEAQRLNKQEQLQLEDYNEFKNKNNEKQKNKYNPNKRGLERAEHYLLFTLTAYTNGPESTGKSPGDHAYGSYSNIKKKEDD